MNALKDEIKNAGWARRLSALTAVISLVALIAYCIYGVVFNYFDTVVCAFLVGTLALSGVHFYLGLGALNLLGAMCTSGAIALFFLNSFPVWADELNGITMYASRGGLPPVIAILVLMFGCALLQIASCFIPAKEGK